MNFTIPSGSFYSYSFTIDTPTIQLQTGKIVVSVSGHATIKAGASKEEISEALGVAVAMNAGAALVYSARVIDAYDQKVEAAAATK